MSLNIDMNMILPLKTHSFVDPKNVGISLMMWKHCVARKYANESTWLARDIVLVRDVIRSDTSEILVAHASFAMEL